MLGTYIASRPREFDFGETAPDGSAWEIFDQVYERNPIIDLEPGYLEMVELWGLWRRGLLPDAGGILDQLAITLDAFDAIEHAVKRLHGEGRGH